MTALARKHWMAAVVAIAACVAAALYFGAPHKGEQAVTTLDPAQVIVVRTPGGMLEVAKLVKNEEYGWSSSRSCPLIDCKALLGETVTRIRVPVHFVYRVPLGAPWTVTIDGGKRVLNVPAMEPATPAAIDLSKMQMETRRGWLSPSTDANRERLLRELQPEIDRRGRQPQYVDAQRKQARKTVAEFAQKWLREQGNPVAGPMHVRFADEGSASL